MKYETEEKGNKEDVAFITLARSQVTFENIVKEMKSLKSSEETRWRRLASPKPEPVFVNLLRSPGIDSQPGVVRRGRTKERLNSPFV
jgi:hypothetical protein